MEILLRLVGLVRRQVEEEVARREGEEVEIEEEEETDRGASSSSRRIEEHPQASIEMVALTT